MIVKRADLRGRQAAYFMKDGQEYLVLNENMTAQKTGQIIKQFIKQKKPAAQTADFSRS